MAVSDRLAKAVFKGIQEQMDRCPYHDVIVVVEDIEFKCHRFLLSACSDFFRALFQSGMKEDLDNKVVLRNMSSNVFKLIIESVYFGKEILTPDNVSSVWYAASLLQISYLQEGCEIFQTKRLSKDNCVNIHIDSKLLSSKRLQDLSLDVIIKEFDHLRKGDDILYLDFEDMKRLVGDDNLTVTSEDVVVETIIRWVKFKPNDFLMEGEKFVKIAQGKSTNKNTSILVDQLKDDSKDSQDLSKNEQNNSSKVLKNKHGTDCKQTLTNYSFNNKREDNISNRREYLFELLTTSKLFLVSQTCLLNLLENKLILEDHKSFSLVRQGLCYNLKLGSRQSYCPPYGIHRKSSLLQNVIFTISVSSSNTMKYLFRTLDGKWFLHATGFDIKCKAVDYGNEIYWTAACIGDSRVYKYDLNINVWKQIASMNVPRQNHALVCLDNYIYAIGGIDDCISIERFDVEAEQKVPGSAKWEFFGNLVQPMTNLMATTCNNMIVIFGSDIEDSPSTIVQTFTPQSASATIVMDKMSGSAINMVSFKHGDDTFVLQENGALWKVSLDSSSLLNIEFHASLWTKPFTLTGAVVTNQELLVFGVHIDKQMPREWEVFNFEHFKRVQIIERLGYFFLNTVIAKKFLVTPES